MGKTKPRIVSPAVQGARVQASKPTAKPAPAKMSSPTARTSLTAKPAPAKMSSPTAKPAPAKMSSPTARTSLTAKPAPAKMSSPTVNPSPLVVPEKKQENTSSKVNSQPTAKAEEKLTLRSLLGTELKDAKSWCRGFAHGTHYDAFLGMKKKDKQAILPYAELSSNQQSAGRRNQWKKEGVFFRIVKKSKRIIDSMGSTGASGGVILFMPLDISLDLKLLSLSSSDTQMCIKPVTPSKAVFNFLKTTGNLATAEIAFGEKIPLSYISEVFLLSGKETKTKEEDATNMLLENGFRKGEVLKNFRGNYQQFVR